MNKRLTLNTSVQLALFFFLLICLLPKSGYHAGDMSCWSWWTQFIGKKNLGGIYSYSVNYQPLFLYGLALFERILDTPEKITESIHYVRIIPILFDLAPVLFLLAIRKFRELASGWHWFLLLNVAYLYNSVIWGQVDSIHSSLSLLALILSLRNPVWSAWVFILAFNVKFQSIIFLPLLIITWISAIRSWGQVVGILLGGVVLEIAILSPFLLAGTFPAYLKMASEAVGYFPYISMNAFNLWDLLLDDMTIYSVRDDETFLLVSYKTAGLILFFLFSALILFPALIKSLVAIIKKRVYLKIWELLFLSAGLITVAFFFFNTQMHERYSHPAMVFFFFYSVYRRNFLLYGLTSLAYLLNMERILVFFDISYHTFIFKKEFIASLFALVLVLGIARLVSAYRIREDLKFLKKRATHFFSLL